MRNDGDISISSFEGILKSLHPKPRSRSVVILCNSFNIRGYVETPDSDSLRFCASREWKAKVRVTAERA